MKVFACQKETIKLTDEDIINENKSQILKIVMVKKVKNR